MYYYIFTSRKRVKRSIWKGFEEPVEGTEETKKKEEERRKN